MSEDRDLDMRRERHEIRQSIGTSSSGALAPMTMAQCLEMAQVLSTSSFVPASYRVDGKVNVADVFAAIQLGSELGVGPMQAMQNIAVINGRPSVWGDLMLALCQSHPTWGGIKETIENDVAYCEVKRFVRGENGRHTIHTVRQSFSVEDAKTAGLWNKKGPWSQYPKRMLQMRARSFALRNLYADVLKGVASVEESMDIVDTTASTVETTDKQLPAETPKQRPKAGVAGLKEQVVNSSKDKRREAPAKAHPGIPESMVKWVGFMNKVNTMDEWDAAMRDWSEAEGDMSAEEKRVFEEASQAARARLGSKETLPGI